MTIAASTYATDLRPEQIEIIEAEARRSADTLRRNRYVFVAIEPGDMTRYEILIAANGPIGDWAVCLMNLSQKTYWWHPSNSDYTDPSYCEAWTDHPWTQQVLAVFLNALREAWKAS